MDKYCQLLQQKKQVFDSGKIVSSFIRYTDLESVVSDYLDSTYLYI